MNVAIIIPAYRPTKALVELVETLHPHVASIVIVDDGNPPIYSSMFDQLKIKPVTILHHDLNRGKGAALKTAFQYILNDCPSVTGVVTCDADGQHAIDDILQVIKQLKKTPTSVVLGQRTLSKNTPFKNRFGNALTRQLFYLLYGLKLEDTQTGLRGMGRAYLRDLVLLKPDRYDYEMAMLIQLARKKVPIESVPVKSIYLSDEGVSSFDPWRDSIRIYRLLFQRLGPFLTVGLSSFLLDYSLFFLFFTFVFDIQLAFLAVIFARIVSGIFNYTLNFYIVFRSKQSHKKTSSRYFSLYIFNLALTACIIQIMTYFVPSTSIIWFKIILDMGLVFMSFIVQKRWVYAP